MKILLFGTGEGYDLYKPFFSKHEVVALLDNDPKKIGQSKDGIPVMSPKDGVKKEYNAVFILSVEHLEEMRRQLLTLGVPIDRIFSYEQIRMRLGNTIAWQPLKVHCPQKQWPTFLENNPLRIAFVTCDLNQSGGAGLGILWVIGILKKRSPHCCINLVARKDGPLRDTYMKLGVPVIVDPNLYVATLDDIVWKDAYDLLFFSTIHFANVFLNGNVGGGPVVWWLHDADMIYRGHASEWLDKVPQGNVAVYAVANLAEKAFHRHCPSWTVKRLPYGVEDRFDGEKGKGLKRKLVFAVIGFVTERKGQAFFLQAIQLLPQTERAKCAFWIIGRNTEKYAKKLMSLYEDMDDVRFFGEVSENELHALYGDISVLVCPSLEDPMPGVCAEAMMYCHPCIVSDKTGTVEYITDGKDGLICKAGDVHDLATKMQWCIENISKIPLMGEAARRIYEMHFSMDCFERAVLSVINENLKRCPADEVFRSI